MLVTFDSNVAGRMIMFADVARQLLAIAGKECTARGVIRAEEVAAIVARLRPQIEQDKAAARAAFEKGEENAGGASEVSLGRRAQPFVSFLERTAKKQNGFVTWEAAADFGDPA